MSSEARTVKILITREAGSITHDFVAERSATSWDRDHTVCTTYVTPTEYDVMCDKLEAWSSLQDTLDELLQERA